MNFSERKGQIAPTETLRSPDGNHLAKVATNPQADDSHGYWTFSRGHQSSTHSWSERSQSNARLPRSLHLRQTRFMAEE